VDELVLCDFPGTICYRIRPVSCYTPPMEERYRKEHELILATGHRPVTPPDIRRALATLGLTPGETLMLHVSLSRVGWIVGGARTVLETLTDHLGPQGLLAMPAHSVALSDPAGWENPPVPESWVPVIRDYMPPYDPDWSSARRLGETVELFRRLPGTLRSAHPHFSLAARGAGAEALTANHAIDHAMGGKSPYGRLYEADASILLFGVGFDNCTLLHLTEYRAEWPGKAEETARAPVRRQGEHTVWQEYRDIPFDADDFSQIGRAFEEQKPGELRRTPLGIGELMLVKTRTLVDFAVGWMEANRRPTSGGEP
jgi:aminoglycoside 3-N-acetyltransferase